MIRERKSTSDLILDEIAGVTGEICNHSCGHHDYEFFTPVCQRAENHAGATVMIDAHAYVVNEDGLDSPVMFTKDCCIGEGK